MGIEWFRDLVLIICALLSTAALVFLATLAYVFCRRAQPILESVKKTTKSMENLSSCVEVEVARPLAQVASFVQGVRQAVGLVSRFTHRKDRDDE